MRVANIHTNINPAFLGIICFNTAKYKDTQNRYQMPQETEIVKEPAPADVVALFDEAGKTISALWPILDRFEDVFAYADNTISDAKVLYNKVCAAKGEVSKGTLREKDNDGTIKMEASFDRNGNLEIIKDYQNNRVIHFNSLPSLELKSEYSYDKHPADEFTVFTDCEDMDGNDTIKAKESFSYHSGALRRYTGACVADIGHGMFYSDFAYSFKRNILTGFDSKYTIAAGTEYSNSCFIFDCKHYDYNCMVALSKASPTRYVENKVFYNGVIHYSTKELRFSDYKFPFECLK